LRAQLPDVQRITQTVRSALLLAMAAPALPMASYASAHHSSLKSLCVSAITPACELTVVVGSKDSEHTIGSCLAALHEACDGLDAEIVVADASLDSTRAIVRSRFPRVALVLCPPDALVPALWDAGLQRARGRHVAFTTAECAVERSWARSLLAGVRRGAAGAGGFFALDRDASAVTRATFYLRYSAYLPGAAGPRAEIAADNACYRREILEQFHDRHAGGFWEVETHRKLRAAGEHLVMVPGAVAHLVWASAFNRLAAARFAHGRRFGAWRVRVIGRAAWKIVAGAPLVPFLIALRSARRALPRREHTWSFLTAMPVLLVLASCWAAGEAVGAASTTEGDRLKEVAA